MAETPSGQPNNVPATSPEQSGAGVGEGKHLAFGLLLAIAKGDPHVLADLDGYFPPKS